MDDHINTEHGRFFPYHGETNRDFSIHFQNRDIHDAKTHEAASRGMECIFCLINLTVSGIINITQLPKEFFVIFSKVLNEAAEDIDLELEFTRRNK